MALQVVDANSISDGVRAEVAPFDVKVVSVATRSIRSNFWKNVGTLMIKEGSLYALVEGKAGESILGELVPMFTDADLYAGKVGGRCLDASSCISYL